MAGNYEEDKWTTKIENLFQAGRLTSHQCTVYNKDFNSKTNHERCGCQRPIRHHSFDGDISEEKPNPKDWNVKDHAKKLQRLIYHSNPSRKFLRCSCESKDDIATLYELMRYTCDIPKLIISIYGGRMHFTLSEDIEKEFMDSLAEIAITFGTWIITSGLNNGVARLVGEGISQFQALTDTKQSTTLLGISWWGKITRKTRRMVLDLQRENLIINNNPINTETLFSFDNKNSHTFEKNHTHFLLLDDGKYRSQYLNKENDQSSTIARNRQLNVHEDVQQQEIEIINQKDLCALTKQQQVAFAKATKYPTEMQRSDFVNYACYAVTIIVEGGINTCLAVLSEIQVQRPVIFIQGSGKIADVLAGLMDLTAKNKYTPARVPEQDEIEHNLRRFPMRARTEKEHKRLIDQIKEIMHPSVRRYLNVFRNNSELNMKQTIFHAIFKAHFAQIDLLITNLKHDTSERSHNESQKLSLLELAIKWNCFEQATDLLAEMEYMEKELLAKLFKQAVDENRPAFVDYFLRINYDPRRTLDLLKAKRASISNRAEASIPLECDNLCDSETLASKDIIPEFQNQLQLGERGLDFIFELYEKPFNSSKRELHFIQPQSGDELDIQYSEWIGSFMWPVFNDVSSSLTMPINELCSTFIQRIKYICCCEWNFINRNRNKTKNGFSTLKKMIQQSPILTVPQIIEIKIRDGTLAEELTQAMLRDLLYWSIFTDRIDMAKVFILHIRTRICAALSCAAILRNRVSQTVTSDKHHLYKQQAQDFENYAIDCINTCYSKNERKACELLIREQPLFGKITCMQVAISSESKLFINTDCFSQVLKRIWYNKISHTDNSFLWMMRFIISFLTLGLLAPLMMSYCLPEVIEKNKSSNNYQNDVHQENTNRMNNRIFLSSQLSNAGVNYYTRYRNSSVDSWQTYVERVKDFHQCPMIKMCYHFIGYIWLLLVFSYMVLFKLVPPTDVGREYHWTEIYTIVTISTMLIEYIRRNMFYYITYMREGQQRSLILRLLSSILKSIPYNLFFIGMGLWYGSRRIPSLFTTAKIILALDLELWYLWSLKFITVIKTLSPKVFMLRDLMGFLYVVLICIAAYGVVSRTMIKQGKMEFTARSLFADIFHAPYWLLYADADDEKKTIDDLTSRNNATNLDAESVATHMLLAFHMILFNILLLNLLIAAFATTISKVETNSRYFYHYQVYTMTQEYFEKPIIPVPPFILICYIGSIIRYISNKLKQCCKKQNDIKKYKYYVTGIFKMIPVDSEFTERCTAFEHAATYDYARRFVENKKGKRPT
ncbi:unnamed protein product [Adineta steineri]|uniref:Uncharacterized protein n=1 Tax=Adineta steineri TaxID=433720 RepID=A0A813U9H3_9BILA|nr:unnamed protein product [Adineta steineri]